MSDPMHSRTPPPDGTGVPGEGRRATPVAIVGGGPVGLMLALFLDRHGVASVVFNREDAVRLHPKGSTHNARTMEHYRRLGLAPAIRNAGLPLDHPTDVAYFTRFNGVELARLRMPSEGEKRRQVADSDEIDQLPEPMLRANQMHVEPLLFEAARTAPNVTLRFGWTVDEIAESATGVMLRATRGDGGAVEHWDAAFAAGCDGGRSFVRERLGIAYEGYENLRQAFFGGRMVSVHLRAPALYRDFLGRRRAWQYWIVNPKIRTAMVALDGGDEFLLWMQSDGDDDVPDSASVSALLGECAGAPVACDVLAVGRWTAGVALVAERFGSGGRILLAGDAVHLFTPTGGFGMNTGVDDAANLAWKLAGAVQGWGGPELLASYEAERKPIALRNTAAARALAQSVGKVPVDPALDDDSLQGAAAREKLGAILATFGNEYASLGVQLGARYDGSPLVVGDAAPPADVLEHYVPSGVPGGRAPHFWVGSGRGAGDSVYDRFGFGFTLLSFDAGTSADTFARAAAMRAAAGRRGVPFQHLQMSDRPRARSLYGADHALVRPDHHIAWRGDALPEHPDRLLALVSGHPAAPRAA